jgi:hypothetical protein
MVWPIICDDGNLEDQKARSCYGGIGNKSIARLENIVLAQPELIAQKDDFDLRQQKVTAA